MSGKALHTCSKKLFHNFLLYIMKRKSTISIYTHLRQERKSNPIRTKCWNIFQCEQIIIIVKEMKLSLTYLFHEDIYIYIMCWSVRTYYYQLVEMIQTQYVGLMNFVFLASQSYGTLIHIQITHHTIIYLLRNNMINTDTYCV